MDRVVTNQSIFYFSYVYAAQKELRDVRNLMVKTVFFRNVDWPPVHGVWRSKGHSLRDFRCFSEGEGASGQIFLGYRRFWCSEIRWFRKSYSFFGLPPKTPLGRGSQNFEIPWDVKKLKCSNPFIWGSNRCKMTREFRIWPWNLNRITFDPLFGQKTVKNRPNLDFPQFWPFFGQKGGQMLSDSNFKARFGILASFCIS